MHVDLVDPKKLNDARKLLGTTSTKATLDLALELLLAQSDFIEADQSVSSIDEAAAVPPAWE